MSVGFSPARRRASANCRSMVLWSEPSTSTLTLQVWQAPLTQVPAQTLPQAPQFALLLRRSVSQPLPALLSQLPKPVLHTS